MLIDYIRVYQHPARINIGCDPPGYPTNNYINAYVACFRLLQLYNDRVTVRFIEAYTNPNLTTWVVRPSLSPRRIQADDTRKQRMTTTKKFHEIVSRGTAERCSRLFVVLEALPALWTHRGPRGHAYRYIRSSRNVSALYQYHTPIIHPSTLICIHQVAHVHEIRPAPEQALLLPIIDPRHCTHSLQPGTLSPPHPIWLRRNVERRRRGITNSAPRAKLYISQRSFICSSFKVDPPSPRLLSEDTQPFTTHSALSPPFALGRLECTLSARSVLGQDNSSFVTA